MGGGGGERTVESVPPTVGRDGTRIGNSC